MNDISKSYESKDDVTINVLTECLEDFVAYEGNEQKHEVPKQFAINGSIEDVFYSFSLYILNNDTKTIYLKRL